MIKNVNNKGGKGDDAVGSTLQKKLILKPTEILWRKKFGWKLLKNYKLVYNIQNEMTASQHVNMPISS